MTSPDLEFFFDPACPFCWMTSKWVRIVQAELGISVRWSYISLVTLNEPYEDGQPSEGHMYGRRAQRVIASAADAHGSEVVGPLYEAIGNATWEQSLDEPGYDAVTAFLAGGLDFGAVLEGLGLDSAHATAVDDDSWDHLLEQSTKEALSRTGDDVGTPILTFRPGQADESSFFGPVISEVPNAKDSVDFYRAIEAAARIPSFAELKRTMRSPLELPMLDKLD